MDNSDYLLFCKFMKDHCTQFHEYSKLHENEESPEIRDGYKEHCYTILFEMYKETKKCFQRELPQHERLIECIKRLEFTVAELAEQLEKWPI